METAGARLRLWYLGNARALPWRLQPSVYRTVVSEFMCQQTQIATVLPYFQRWTQRWPDFACLAAATPEDVLSAWQGLGYYSRAQRLHQLARAWCAAEVKPVAAGQWQKFPGIGPYTAAAIASIHFDEAVAVVDGNVIRVLSRFAGLDETFSHQQAAAKALAPLAAQMLDRSDPGTHNQAMMELGALVCTKARPSCLLCPLRPDCVAYQQGNAAQLPRIRRAVPVARRVLRLWCVREGCLLLERYAPTAKRLANLCELPELEPEDLLPDGSTLDTIKRGISNERIEEVLIAIPGLDPSLLKPKIGSSWIWADTDALAQLPLSGPHGKWIPKLLKKHPLCTTPPHPKQ